jgi:glutamine synthetase
MTAPSILMPPSNLATTLRRQMAAGLAEFGIHVDAMHHEVATGQHKIDFRYSGALRNADNAVTKAIAQQNGHHCIFLPKSLRGVAGSSMHVHQSFVYTGTGINTFADSEVPHGLPELPSTSLQVSLPTRGECVPYSLDQFL